MTSKNPPTGTVTFVRFTLRMLEPGGVAVPVPSRRGEVDAVVDVDCHGVAHIPGTSLAGALRERTRAGYGAAAADAWFGRLVERGTGRPDEVDSVASAIRVLGSQLVSATGERLLSDEAARLDRWSTAIDRGRAAARSSSLRGATVLAPDTRIEAFLRWDDVAEVDRDRLLWLLAGWRPVIGRGASRGYGRCQVENLLHGTLDLGDPRDLLTWLTSGGPELARTVATHRPPARAADRTPPASPAPATVVEIPARIVGPLHVGGGARGAERAGRGQDNEGTGEHEVRALLRERGRYVLPGAALKGVLRSRVEFILRSIDPTPESRARLACESSSDAGAACGTCWCCGVFGHGGGRDPRAGSVGRRSGVRFCDAHVEDPVTRERTHVALDRFTGGGMDRLLYTVEVLEAGRFTLRIVVDADHAGDRVLSAVLRVALADLHERRIGLGSGTTRGYGSVDLDIEAAQSAGTLPDLATARAALRDLVAARLEEAPR